MVFTLKSEQIRTFSCFILITQHCSAVASQNMKTEKIKDINVYVSTWYIDNLKESTEILLK